MHNPITASNALELRQNLSSYRIVIWILSLTIDYAHMLHKFCTTSIQSTLCAISDLFRGN